MSQYNDIGGRIFEVCFVNIGWGIDVGVGSLGFAVIELDSKYQPQELIDGVSKVYPAPTGGAERTRYKSMRTQNQRQKKRISALRSELARLFELDPEFDAERPGRTLPTASRATENQGARTPASVCARTACPLP